MAFANIQVDMVRKKTNTQFTESKSGRIKDRISVLPDDLLMEILLLLPAKIAGSTVILSKRWRSFWAMQPELVMHLKKQADLGIETVVCSGLRACTIRPRSNVDWLEPFMCSLQNSPKLKTLVIIDEKNEDFPLSFNLPSYVPACLSTHLEIIKWKGYGGQHGQKKILRYILANSKCLKRLHISIKSPPRTFNDHINKNFREKKMKLWKELVSMHRDSTSLQLTLSAYF